MSHLLKATLAVAIVMSPLIALLLVGTFTDRMSSERFERLFGWLDRTDNRRDENGDRS